MARPKKKRKARPEKGGRASARSGSDTEGAALQFSRINGLFAALGLLALIVGYWLLAQGSITAAPVLLVVGYVVLLPLAVIL